MFRSTLLTSIAFLGTTGWAQYVLQDDYCANGNFYDNFDFYNGTDPTNGYVDYVERDYAQSAGLIGDNYGKVYLGVDHSGIASKAGRPAVRIESRKTYDTGLIVIDIEHMPGGICGTWPAFWMFGPNWPKNGEIDIIEGVNDVSTNDMTLHTGPDCKISRQSDMQGSVSTDDCYVNAEGQSANQGCQIKTQDTRTYGSGFNANGGGVYATEITSSFINIFFFPRGSLPSDISSASPDPSSWGKPMAVFKGDCDIPSHFKDMSITFSNTFCGDWAGNVWKSQGECASKADTCVDYVKNNPEAFKDAYWSINSLKIYKHGSGAYASTEAVSSYSTSTKQSYSESSSAPVYSSSYSTSTQQSYSESASAPVYSSAPAYSSGSSEWSSSSSSSRSRKRPHYSTKVDGFAMPTGVPHDPWTASETASSTSSTFAAEQSGYADNAPTQEKINVASEISTTEAAEARQPPDGWYSRGAKPHGRHSERALKHLKKHKKHGSSRLL